ncbi:MAG: MFS transporter [Fimbriimonas sp.]
MFAGLCHNIGVARPETLSRLETLDTLRIANLDVAFATAFITLVTGGFLVGFVNLLGGGDLWVGVLTAIPSLVGLLQIPGGAWGRSFSSFKPFITVGGLTWRVCHLPLVVLPLVPLANDFKLTLLAVCMAVGWSASVIVSPVYSDYMAEMVPPGSRGAYFSKRNAIAAAVGATAGLLGGILLDAFKRSGHAEWGFTTVFSIGTIASAVSLGLFIRLKDIPRANPASPNIGEMVRSLRAPFRDRDFRKVLAFLGMFTLGQSFGGNLFAQYALEVLHLDFTWLQSCAFAFAVGTVISSRGWGYLNDKYGSKPMMALAAAGLILNPVVWIICRPGDLTINVISLILAHVLMGVIFAGVALCQFNLLLATAKAEERATYLGAGLALQALVGGLSPLVGAWLMAQFRVPFGAEFGFKGVFIVIMVLRMSACLFLFPVREEGAERFRTTVQQITRIRPRGLRALRDLSRVSSPSERVSAIQAVASENLQMARDDLIEALHDPAPRVRRQAASALAGLHDAKAVEALVHQLQEHPDLVEEETIEALGEIGGAEAVDALLATLQSPRSILRRAAAKALGRADADPDSPEGIRATTALIESARVGNDPDLRRASLQALRQMGARGIEAVAADALADPTPSVRIAAAEATAELGLDIAPALRASLDQYQDEASAEVAYALGAVGLQADTDRILEVAQRSVSIITRRRCLLGVARLHQVERATYLLLLGDEATRDQAVIGLATGIRQGKSIRKMIERYASGDEEAALQELAREKDPVFASLCRFAVPESLFLAVTLLRK